MKCAIQPSARFPPIAPASMSAGFIGGIPIIGAPQSPTPVITAVPAMPPATARPILMFMGSSLRITVVGHGHLSGGRPVF